MNNQHKRSCRKIIDSDRAFLRRLFDSSWQRALAAAAWPPELQAQVLDHQFEAQDSSYRLESPKADYDLILIDGKPAGRIYVDRSTEQIKLMEMTLLPEYRNKKIGSALIWELQEEARGCGKAVSLYVEHWNPDARRLYQRLGFRDEEDIGTHWKMRWDPA